MAHEPSLAPQVASKPRGKSGGACIACMVFVAAMGAAFWMGTVWASQTWIAVGG